ncbi:hypothetical protein ACWFRK_17690, partial [Streptomyces sp. NPDC055157]
AVFRALDPRRSDEGRDARRTGVTCSCARFLTAGTGTADLDVGGTVTATLDGKTSTRTVSGLPNVYRVVSGGAARPGVLTLTFSPGLSATHS